MQAMCERTPEPSKTNRQIELNCCVHPTGAAKVQCSQHAATMACKERAKLHAKQRTCAMHVTAVHADHVQGLIGLLRDDNSVDQSNEAN